MSTSSPEHFESSPRFPASQPCSQARRCSPPARSQTGPCSSPSQDGSSCSSSSYLARYSSLMASNRWPRIPFCSLSISSSASCFFSPEPWEVASLAELAFFLSCFCPPILAMDVLARSLAGALGAFGTLADLVLVSLGEDGAASGDCSSSSSNEN